MFTVLVFQTERNASNFTLQLTDDMRVINSFVESYNFIKFRKKK